MEPTYAYLAGIVDGEGTIWLAKRSDRPSLKPTIKVNMTERAVLDLLQKTFGGTVRLRPRAKPHYKDQWIWGVTNNMARKCIESLLPHLIVKRASALDVLGYMNAGKRG